MSKKSTQELFEEGRLIYFSDHSSVEEKNEGLRMIKKAGDEGNPDAMFTLAILMLTEKINVTGADRNEQAAYLLCCAANEGSLQARALLNSICEKRYAQKEFPESSYNGPLVDFDGKKIKINRKGILTPVDVHLVYADGQNILKISVNVQFIYPYEIHDSELFEQAVLDGIRQWEGDYEVFGGQKLKVEVEITTEDRAFDNVFVLPATRDFMREVAQISSHLGKKAKEKTDMALEQSRSFAALGLKWSVRSRKIIFLQNRYDRFGDYGEIADTAKHEFGHVLGLGDLYESRSDALDGVGLGTYSEIDAYHIKDRLYNLVMCLGHGVISNNDIEMVIMAFRDNEIQLYQPQNYNKKISEVLGRGN